MSSAAPEFPLKGIKVVEIGTLIAGPYAAAILAQFGAEVIKIESPGSGDPLRTWRKLHEGTSLWWYAQSRNKKSVTVNLKHPDGQSIVRDLCKDADIVIENATISARIRNSRETTAACSTMKCSTRRVRAGPHSTTSSTSSQRSTRRRCQAVAFTPPPISTKTRITMRAG